MPRICKRLGWTALALAGALFQAGTALAASTVVTYEFTAQPIESVWVVDLNTNTSTELAGIDVLGGRINFLDGLHGTLSYQPLDAVGVSLPAYTSYGAHTQYTGANVSLSYTDLNTGFTYSPTAASNTIDVYNNGYYSGDDAVLFTTTATIDGVTYTTIASIQESHNDWLSSTAIPISKLEDSTLAFSNPGFIMYWTIDNQRYAVYGRLGLHLVSAVPEPESWAMLLGGLGLGAVARRRRSLRA